MRIRFTTYTMPGHVPGEIADLPESEARQFIARNVAVPLAEPAKVETATQRQPVLETATLNTTPATPATPPAVPITPVVIDLNSPVPQK